VVLVPHQPFHVQRGGVVEQLARFLDQERRWVEAGSLPFFLFLEDQRFGFLEDAVQSPQHGERQDDTPVFRLLVVAAEQVGDSPNER
jgi:hypothetical protein